MNETGKTMKVTERHINKATPAEREAMIRLWGRPE